jgi:cytochrome P450
MAALPLPPGPRGHFLIGHLPEFRRDMLGFLTRMAREYGDCVAFRLGWKRVYLVNHPDLIESVLVADSRHYIKHYVLRLLRPTFGNGLLLSEGDFWLRQRRLVQPAFHRDRIAAYGAIMVTYAERMLAAWQDGETRDIHRDMMRLTLEIVAKALFDADVAAQAQDVGDALETGMQTFVRRWRSVYPLPVWIPTPTNLRIKRTVRRLDAIIYGFIKERRATGRDRGDLLSMLLQAQDADDGTRMTDKQVRDEAMTLFLAGHETTANALSWTWYLLSQHPEVEAKLTGELETVLGGRSPTVADLPRLRYTEMVVTESMRLFPPVYAFGREAVRDGTLGGYRVRRGTTVVMSQWVMHRHPAYFDNPEQSYPERWADGLAKRLPKFAYFPFGGGPRLCIGNSFAMMETVLILATMVPKFRFTMLPNYPVVPRTTVTLRPEHGIKGILSKRAALPRLHALRGNADPDALRPESRPEFVVDIPGARDAERGHEEGGQ